MKPWHYYTLVALAGLLVNLPLILLAIHTLKSK